MFRPKQTHTSLVDSRAGVPAGASLRWLRAWLIVLAALCTASPSLAAERPNVLLITLDTTRADHLGLYGYPKDTSPNLDQLAEDSLVYTRAYSTSSWTLPAHASLFTGVFPTTHGARYDAEGSLVLKDGIRGKKLARFRASPLATDRRVLAEILQAAGYATGAVVAGPWMKQVFGLSRGFDHYDDSSIDDVHGKLADAVTAQASAWVDERISGGAQPFFLFLNYYDPHGPYTDPEGYARKFLPPNTVVFPPPRDAGPEFVNGVYDGEIHYMDEHLGALFDHLKAKGLYDDMLIIVTADHGELLGEHDKQGHGSSLYEEELRIPFLVKYPRGERKPGRSDSPVQLTDVLPLVLERVAIAAPPGVQGRAAREKDQLVYAEVYPLLGADPLVDWRISVDGDFKYVWTSGGKPRLFDLRLDPGEQVDLAPEQSERLRGMAERQATFLSKLPVPERAEEAPVETIDEETRRALEGLGYLE